ncbi:MAG: glycosyltransferase [Nitrospirota bacterium]
MSVIKIDTGKIITDVKSVIRLILSIGLYYSGALRLYKHINRKNSGIKILAYHDISDKSYLNLQVPEKIFKKHIEYLVNHNYNIISLKDAVNLLRNNKPISEDTVVITFDDGYKSVYTTVFPMIKQYGIPITVFLTIEPLENGIPPFVDAVAYAIENTSKDILDLSSWNKRKYSIKPSILKEKAIYEINDYSKKLSTKDRKELLEFIFKQIGISLEEKELRHKMLSWGEVIEMSRSGIVEFGAHTLTHSSLSRIPISESNEEILKSKEIIEKKLNKKVDTFAYPYGSEYDVNEEVRDIVERNGFSCACILRDGANRNGTDLFLLRRLCITHLIPKLLQPFSKAEFAVKMSGIYDFIRNRFIKGKTQRDKPKKMNILYMIDQLKGGAGTERHLVNLAIHLDKDKFNSMICFFEGRNGSLQQTVLEQGIPVKNLNLSRIYAPKAILQAIKLAGIIKKNKIDIVQTFHFKSDTYGVLVSKLSGVSKIISSRRDTGDLKKPRQIFLNKLMNRFIDQFIMVCNSVGERFHKSEHIPKDKTITIYNGVDLKRFNPDNGIPFEKIRKDLDIKESDFVIGITAIFRPEKAYHIFFEGIEKAMPVIKNLKVLVLGYGVTKEYFEDYCSKRPLNHIVRFMGYVENVEDYLSLMDVFCLVPNKNEGFSNAILEAMAMGKPVIATDVGGNAESVLHNETGIIIPPDDSDSLAEAILELYKNPAKRLKMGEKARKRAEEQFPMEKMIREHENLYEKIFSGQN